MGIIIIFNILMKKISFAIIGGGPAGFYVSKLLSKLACEPRIDIY
jgi:cation diffusion facilitator CzcD-associated flavoprotein CzcO